MHTHIQTHAHMHALLPVPTPPPQHTHSTYTPVIHNTNIAGTKLLKQIFEEKNKKPLKDFDSEMHIMHRPNKTSEMTIIAAVAVVLLNVLGCRLTYKGQTETNGAWFNIALHPWKP